MEVEAVERSLGRIEGAQTQILSELQQARSELRQLRTDFGDHKNDDQSNFSSVRKLFYDKIREQNELRENHLTRQDTTIAALKQDSDRAKGAGWAILGLLGAMATVIGGAVLSVLEGRIKLHY